MVGGQWSYNTLSDIIDATNGRLPYAFKTFLVWARKATVSCSHDRLEHFFNHSQDIADEVLPFDTLMYDKDAVSLSKPICGTTSITASLDGLLDGRAAMIAGENVFGLDRDGGYIIAGVNSDGYLESADGSRRVRWRWRLPSTSSSTTEGHTSRHLSRSRKRFG